METLKIAKMSNIIVLCNLFTEYRNNFRKIKNCLLMQTTNIHQLLKRRRNDETLNDNSVREKTIELLKNVIYQLRAEPENLFLIEPRRK